jgi:hypothetical protein
MHSLFNPSQLAPSQRKDWTPEGRGPYSAIMKTVTNPLVIIGVALAVAYPPASARSLIKFSQKIAGHVQQAGNYSKALVPGAHLFQSFHSILGNTSFGRLMTGLFKDAHHFKEKVMHRYSVGLLQAENAMGRSATMGEQVASHALLDGLDDYGNLSWKLVRGRLKKSLKGTMPDEQLQAFVDKVGQTINPGGLQRLAPRQMVESAEAALGEGWEMMFTEANMQRLFNIRLLRKVRALEKKMAGAKNTTLRKKYQKQFKDAATEWEQTAPAGMADQLYALGVDLGVDPKQYQSTGEFVFGVLDALKKKEFRRLGKYAPHINARKTYADTAARLDDLSKQLLGKPLSQAEARELRELGTKATPAQRRAMAKAGALPESGHIKARANRMMPSAQDFELINQHFTPETQQALNMLAKADELPQYSMRLTSVMSNYSHSMSRTYGFTARGALSASRGEMLQTELGKLKIADKQGIKYRLASDTYMPLAMGRLSESETMYALAWGDAKYKAWKFFQSDKMKQWMPEASKKLTAMMEMPMVQDLTMRNAGAKLAGAMYLSTLGLNPTSAGLNLMQNLMTTSGIVHPKYMLQGLQKTTKDMGKFAEYMNRGMKLEPAFDKAFPYYAKYVGQPSEVEALAAMRRSRAGGTTWAARGETAKAGMMSFFTGTERFNKVLAFNIGEAAGLGEKLPLAAAQRVGAELSTMTQFPGGPLNTPSGFVNLWPPFRQFTQFPAKTAELFFSRSRQVGRLEAEALPGLRGELAKRLGNLGGPGRMLAASGLVYGAGQAVDLDLSRGLLFGAMPAPYGPDAPFYPSPFVPPVLSIAGSVAGDIYEGEFERTRKVLPLLVPGGVSLARTSTVVAPKLAEQLGRPFADYANQRPDGTIPVYSSQGSLKGFQSPLSLFKDAVGWTSLTGNDESALMEYMVSQRDRIREFRREYIESIAANDWDGANRTQDRYTKLYPELGKIVIKPSDIRAVHLRHDVSRIERVMETMPAEAREMFGPMVGVALGEAAEGFLGVDPGLLSRGTIKSRTSQRAVPAGPQARQMRQASERGQGIPALRADQIGRGPNEAFSAFEAFSLLGG